MDFTDAVFAKRAEKVIERLAKEPQYYLGTFEDVAGNTHTTFGTGDIMIDVPFKVGEPQDEKRAVSVCSLVKGKFLKDEYEREMWHVGLPRSMDIRAVGTRKSPVLMELTAQKDAGLYGAPPEERKFTVQARLLREALTVMPGHAAGERLMNSIYNPLIIRALDDHGRIMTAVVMPYLQLKKE